MPYRVVSLASGSKGNSLLVSGPRLRLLVDMGLSQRRIVAELAAEGLRPGDLDGIFLTHTHTDHVRDTCLKFCWRHRVPLVGPRENLAVLRRRYRNMADRLDRAGLLRDLPPRGLHVKACRVRPFAVPHDAEGLTLGYHLTLADGGTPFRLAVATDLGEVPGEALRTFARADVLVLEANHDPGMLEASGRPPVLIDRIRGAEGHLANAQAAEAVGRIASRVGPRRLRQIVLAHLSEECNEPALALETVRRHLEPLGAEAPPVRAAAQHRPVEVVAGSRARRAAAGG